MKKTIRLFCIILVAVIGLSFSACKERDERLVGRWESNDRYSNTVEFFKNGKGRLDDNNFTWWINKWSDDDIRIQTNFDKNSKFGKNEMQQFYRINESNLRISWAPVMQMMGWRSYKKVD